MPTQPIHLYGFGRSVGDLKCVEPSRFLMTPVTMVLAWLVQGGSALPASCGCACWGPARPPLCACPAGQSCVNGVRTGNYYDNALPITSATGLSYPTGLAMDVSLNGTTPNRRLWVADGGNSRAIRFDLAAFTAYPYTANGLYGEPDFTSRIGGSALSLNNFPSGVAVDGAANVYVADTGNNRALGFAFSTINSGSATLVLGQPNLSGIGANANGVSRESSNAQRAVAVDRDGRVVVADSDNNRVLIYFPQ